MGSSVTRSLRVASGEQRAVSFSRAEIGIAIVGREHLVCGVAPQLTSGAPPVFGMPKRKSVGSSQALHLLPDRVAPHGASQSEFDELWQTLSRCAQSTKTVESTVEGEPPFEVETSLPSYFDYYPALKRRVSEAEQSAAVEIMRQALKFIETGNKAFLKDPASMGIGEVIDLSSDGGAGPEAESEGPARWQVCLGDHGWVDLDDAANALCEKARSERRASAFTFTGFQGMPYMIDIDKLIQKNQASGTVRPLRRTMTNALFG